LPLARNIAADTLLD